MASHISALGAKCHFLSVVGDDNNAKIIEEKLKAQKIASNLIKDISRPTTFKKKICRGESKII